MGVIDKLSDLSKEYEKGLYIFIADQYFAASTRKHDIDEFLKDEDMWSTLQDIAENDILMIYGVVVDPRSIPMVISEKHKKATIWVIYGEDIVVTSHYGIDNMEKFTSVDAAKEYIEDLFSSEEIQDISEVTVIIGYEIDLMAQVATHTHGILDMKRLESDV